MHRLCVDERSDVVGADPGRAPWTSLLHFGDLLDGFRDGIQLHGASISIAAVPLAHLHRCGQALQGHADWPRTLPGSLGAQLDLRCRAAAAAADTAKRFLPISSSRGLRSIQSVTV